VAGELVRAAAPTVRERLLGMPEKLFARVNQVLPGLVDSGLRKQLDTISPLCAPRRTATHATRHIHSELPKEAPP